MVYNVYPKHTVEFRDIEEGEIFLDSSNIAYMKIVYNERTICNAVCLGDGELSVFNVFTIVQPVDYELNITKR